MLTKEQILQLGLDKRNDLTNKSWNELVLENNLDFKNGDCFRKWIGRHIDIRKDKEIHKNLNDKDLEYKETVEIKSDGTQSSDKLLKMSQEESKDVNYLLNAHGYDTTKWELVSARNNIWNVYSKQNGIQTLYSSKIVVKPISEYVWNEENALKIFDCLQNKSSTRKNIIPLQYEQNGKTLVFPIADFHYGLYSDKFSTGNDYNTKIARELFYYTVDDVINRVSGKSFEKIIFVLGNDLINFDNLNGTTTKGTPQDNNGFWFTIVEEATEIIIDGIDKLEKIAPVEVLYVPSNHDLHTTFGIMQTLKHHYKNDENINIDTSPLPRKYHMFGDNLLCLSHNMKIKETLKIITTEAKDIWSSCNHVITMLAHLHQSMVYEKEGMLEIIRLPTISGWSRWTNTMGYVQTDKRNKAFIFSEKLGITDEINTIIID